MLDNLQKASSKLEEISSDNNFEYYSEILLAEGVVEFDDFVSAATARNLRPLKKLVATNVYSSSKTNVEKILQNKKLVLDVFSVGVDKGELISKALIQGENEYQYFKTFELISKYHVSDPCQLKYNLLVERLNNRKTTHEMEIR